MNCRGKEMMKSVTKLLLTLLVSGIPTNIFCVGTVISQHTETTFFTYDPHAKHQDCENNASNIEIVELRFPAKIEDDMHKEFTKMLEHPDHFSELLVDEHKKPLDYTEYTSLSLGTLSGTYRLFLPPFCHAFDAETAEPIVKKNVQFQSLKKKQYCSLIQS